MARTKIGQVSILPCGQYDSTKKYERLSVVLFEGSSYIAIKENQGQAVTNTEYWYKLTEKGDKGDTYSVTEEDLQAIADKITADANSKFNEHVSEKTDEFDNNATNITTAFDTHVEEKTTEFNENATTQTNTFNTNVIDKTNEFNQNAENKTEEFNANAESIEKRLDRLESIQDTQVATGENVYFDNAKNYPLMNLKGEGKSEQITTTGKNLFDTTVLPITQDGITVSLNEKGEVVLNGTPTITSNYSMIQMKTKSFDAGTYTLSVKNKRVGIGIGIPIGAGALSLTLSDTINTKTVQCESGSGTCDIKVRYDVGTLTNYVLNPQLELSSTATSYEPYTGGQATPNPNYKQEIKTITEANYKGTRKNIFDITKIPIVRTVSYTSLGELVYWTGYSGTREYLKVAENTIYTFTNDLNINPYIIVFYDKDLNVLSTDWVQKSSYVMPEKCCYIRMAFNVAELPTWVQIEKGTEATPYEPHQETTLPIDLQGNELCELDKLLIDRKGNVAIEKNEGKTVLNSNEGWFQSGNTNDTYFVAALNGAAMTNIFDVSLEGVTESKCTHMKYTQRLDFNAGFNFYNASGNRWSSIGLSFLKSKIPDLTTFKEWLSQNHMTIYYRLATPQLINLGKIENPEIFKGVNHIEVETNLGNMQIEVEYVEDLQVRIEKLEQAFVAMGGI